MKKHWMTSLFGFLAALSAAVLNAPGMGENKTVRGIAGIIQVVSLLGMGAAAADANKSTNGSGGPK
jgi:hypothetical protein